MHGRAHPGSCTCRVSGVKRLRWEECSPARVKTLAVCKRLCKPPVSFYRCYQSGFSRDHGGQGDRSVGCPRGHQRAAPGFETRSSRCRNLSLACTVLSPTHPISPGLASGAWQFRRDKTVYKSPAPGQVAISWHRRCVRALCSS